jgi:formylglycine-generating enzyme required for sulfatase activity
MVSVKNAGIVNSAVPCVDERNEGEIGDAVPQGAGSVTLPQSARDALAAALRRFPLPGAALAAAFALAAVHAPAATLVTNVAAKQRFPWNGLVDIEYEIVTDRPADAEWYVGAAASNTLTGAVYPVRTATGEGAANGTVGAGTRRLVWNAAADAPGVVATAMVVTVAVSEKTRYLVVDLSGGADAAAYPVRAGAAAPDPADGACRTTELWLRKVVPGTFTMGSPPEETGRQSGETQHRVTLTRPYHIGVFEVTQKQWQQVMGSNPALYSGDTRPVEGVSYADVRGASAGAQWPASDGVDAASFMGRLRGKTGLSFDLPTEAQWEYACRAGTASALNSGSDLTAVEACPNMGAAGRYLHNGGEAGRHAPAGSYAPNGWGLYDMHGNAWEWCLDWHADALDAADATDPSGPSSGTSGRVRRGGGWNSDAQRCRSAQRGSFPASTGYPDTGVRVAAFAGQEEGFDAAAAVAGASVPFALDARAGLEAVPVGSSVGLSYSPAWGQGAARVRLTVWPEGAAATQTVFESAADMAGEFLWDTAGFIGVCRLEHLFLDAADAPVGAPLTAQVAVDAGLCLRDATESGPGWAWTNVTDTGWFRQTNVMHDGVDAAQSGAVGDNGRSVMQATVTGPGAVSFWYRTSCEFWDRLVFSVDGVAEWGASGDDGLWRQASVAVGAGTHTLTWAYVKDESGAEGEDCAWVDEVVWAAAFYTVTFSANGGTGGPGIVSNVAWGAALPAADAPTRQGYTFTGYYDALSGGTQYYTADMTPGTWDKSSEGMLYARWTANRYTVTLDRNGGSGAPASVTATYGSAMPTASAPARDGYTFLGYWDTYEPSGGTQYYTAAMTSARVWDKPQDAALYARWSVVTYTVTFDKNGGSNGTASVGAVLGAPMPSAEPPVRAGYTFDGYDHYDDAVSGRTRYYNADMTSARVWDKTSGATLHAQWTANKYTVTLDPNGGSGGAASVPAKYGSPLPSAAAAPARAGRAFLGYFDAPVGGTRYYDADMTSARAWDKAGHATLYAHWGGATATTSAAVPYEWLDIYFDGLSAAGDYEDAALADQDGDGLATWAEYVAGTDPSNPDSVFRITWFTGTGIEFSPRLDDRVYTVLGKAALADPEWVAPTNSGHRFFRVRVALP